MIKKLKCILLIDDDEATNFIHEMVIKQNNCAENVIASQSAKSALEYLTTKTNGSYPQPDLIFLDINMPGLNGWEFLDRYKLLEENQKGNVVVVMLTNSLNPDDQQRANDLPQINNFSNKPLNGQKLTELINDHFPDLMD